MIVQGPYIITEVKLPLTKTKTHILPHLIVSLANPQQVKIQKPTKKSKSFEITNDKQETFKERNAILRYLCSTIAPLNNFPLSLMGDDSSNLAALANIHSYMSMALSIYSKSAEECVDLLKDLDQHLAGSCAGFVAGTTLASLADWDLYLSLATNDGLDLSVELKDLLNVQRWFEATQSSIHDANVHGIELPEKVAFQKGKSMLPSFYYPDLTVAAAASPSAADDKGENKDKKQDSKEKKDGKGGGELTDEQKKAAAEKRAKKQAEKAAKKKNKAPAPQASAAATLDVSALDIRVGKILKAWEHPEAEKLYCEEVDVGEEKPRQIASGLRPFYKLEEMQNQDVLVLCNLKARNLVGFPSHGMVMCASNDDHTKVEFAIPPSGAKVGDRVMFDSFTGEPEAENKMAKKKMFEKIAPDLKTDAEGKVLYKGKLGSVGGEACRAKNGMANAHVA